MPLSAHDAMHGTIVDHSWERGDDGKRKMRELRRRGIIVHAPGEGSDTIGG